jgi:N-acetylglucosamine malate deacetylase 1
MTIPDPSRILVLAAHTDDGELGCGGSIARFVNEGREIFYAAFSTCAQSLPDGLPADTLANECKTATALLGIKKENLFIHDFEVRRFPAARQEILERLIVLKKQIEPDLVFVPSVHDIHQDHGIIHDEGIRAFKNTAVLGYELPWNHTRFQSNFFIRLTREELQKKIQAIKAYKSQAHRSNLQEEIILSLARVRGVHVNTEFAEAFELYRMTI